MKKRIGAGKSYADILTVLLVIIIIAILSLLGFFAYKIVHTRNVEADAAEANDDFLATAKKNMELIEKAKKSEGDLEIPTEIDTSALAGILDKNNNGESSETEDTPTEQEQPTTTEEDIKERVPIKKSYMGDYEIKGSISIPKTNCNYAILEKVTPASLSKSVAIMEISANPELNKTVTELNVPGTNAYIMGHNYLNGQFFSDNDKLSIGDKIKITDPYNETVTYTIYNMYYTTANDVSFMYRDIPLDTREITLQTCNENSTQRLIIWAKDK